MFSSPHFPRTAVLKANAIEHYDRFWTEDGFTSGDRSNRDRKNQEGKLLIA